MQTRNPSLLAALMLGLAALPQCGNPVPQADSGDVGVDSVDARADATLPDTRGDVASDAARCPDGSSACGAQCVDTRTDPHHCGSCTTDCTLLPGVDPSVVACVAGACDLTHGCAPNRMHCSATAR
ncbi:MAG: hypothetical protein WCJ30_27855, partial [Deltaproteobacteria bacterium]